MKMSQGKLIYDLLYPFFYWLNVCQSNHVGCEYNKLSNAYPTTLKPSINSVIRRSNKVPGTVTGEGGI